MKTRWLLPIALSACLVLTACHKSVEPAPTPAETEPPAPPVEEAQPLVLDSLNVEFVVDGRDPDALLTLRTDFPEALRAALERRNVSVGEIAVTFGASGEATEAALQSGEVQLAFLSAEDYYPYRSGQIVAAEQGDEPALTLGLIVAAVSDDAEADDRFADSMRDALPELTDALAPYAAAPYGYDSAQLEQLASLYEQEAAGQVH